ncbi:MAG: transposase [Alphaproteobacteria bacterium]|nr:transposase [Alphaproteobacteria bacterium]
MDFVAVDVETANEDLSSICQIGVVLVEGGKPSSGWESLVNPEDDFSGINVSIHGIDEQRVKDAPTLPAIYDGLERMFCGRVVVSHTGFDRASLRLASTKYALSPIDCEWLDSARLARRAWPQFAERGYGLANIASALGIQFRHHDALEDAKACAEIVIRAIADSGTAIETWLEQLKHKGRGSRGSIARTGSSDGPLASEVVVFTGALSISRIKAADLAAQAGAAVAPGVTKNTTLLVVGDQDIRRLAGHEKSSKHRKAEAMIMAGAPLRIVTESDFQRLVAGE